jgi:hypothetical protein
MSAANADPATETASAAATDNTTFFIESAPLNSIGALAPVPFAHLLTRQSRTPVTNRADAFGVR